jgi:hypothetical protein
LFACPIVKGIAEKSKTRNAKQQAPGSLCVWFSRLTELCGRSWKYQIRRAIILRKNMLRCRKSSTIENLNSIETVDNFGFMQALFFTSSFVVKRNPIIGNTRNVSAFFGYMHRFWWRIQVLHFHSAVSCNLLELWFFEQVRKQKKFNNMEICEFSSLQSEYPMFKHQNSRWTTN